MTKKKDFTESVFLVANSQEQIIIEAKATTGYKDRLVFLAKIPDRVVHASHGEWRSSGEWEKHISYAAFDSKKQAETFFAHVSTTGRWDPKKGWIFSIAKPIDQDKPKQPV